jgi:hypothetical protein
VLSSILVSVLCGVVLVAGIWLAVVFTRFAFFSQPINPPRASASREYDAIAHPSGIADSSALVESWWSGRRQDIGQVTVTVPAGWIPDPVPLRRRRRGARAGADPMWISSSDEDSLLGYLLDLRRHNYPAEVTVKSKGASPLVIDPETEDRTLAYLLEARRRGCPLEVTVKRK